uniref:Anoctamin n=1 Tax=Mesocestoides corti TaxID=53468 RepID=A0A5K3FBR5_MESCO
MGGKVDNRLFRSFLNRATICAVQGADEDDIFNLDGCEYYSNSPEMFFRDGKRRIDFVLVYKLWDRNENHEAQRFAFLSALADQMIEIEVEDCQGNIVAATGPQKAGFKDEAGFGGLRPPEITQAYADKQELEALEKEEKGTLSPLERAIMSVDDVVFVKLHASWATLARVAEVLQFKKPLKQAKLERLKLSEGKDCCKCLKPDKKSVLELPSPYRAAFTRARINLFDIPEDYDKFFTPTERTKVVDYVLKRTGTYRRVGGTSVPSGPPVPKPEYPTEADINVEKETGARPCDIKLAQKVDIDLGIDHLVNEGVFCAAFPLHEPSTEMTELLTEKEREVTAAGGSSEPKYGPETNMRTMLCDQWGSLTKMFKYQPLDYVRLYFGESVAFYFAWLGLYTSWLIPVGIFGLLVFCLSAIDIADDQYVEDVCTHGSDFLMCPPCSVKGCKFWLLNSSCFAAKMTHLVDNLGTVLFAVFMALWATLFMEQWKRYQNVLAHRWNVQNLEPVDEPPRPEFLALLNKKNFPRAVNPITGREEPVIPFWSRKVPVLVVTYASVLFGVVLCLAFLIGVIFYRLVVNVMLLQSDNALISSVAGMITTITSSCINLVCIFILKMVYDRVAVIMTNIEDHRTQSEYNDSLTLKLYLLQFVNFYSSIFYIAFIQGTTAAIPGDKTIPIQSSGCDSGNCLFQLFIQLAIVMVGKQFLNFVTENTLPPLKRVINVYLARRRAAKKLDAARAKVQANETAGRYGSLGTGKSEPAGWTSEAEGALLTAARQESVLFHCRSNYTLLDGGSRPLFDEYLEMLIQYGFITMFVPAFPLAPLFALLNNMFEVRTDAKKFLAILRRPVIMREKSIGIWFGILSVVSSLAIRTNACLIAFTSDFLVRLTYTLCYSPDHSLTGYLNFTLSYMDINRFNLTGQNTDLTKHSPYCRYNDFREPPSAPDPYSYTPVHWQILAIKFAFVFVFENVALALTSLIANFIPDIPQRLVIISRHEARVINELILQGEVDEDDDREESKREPLPINPPPIGFFSKENPDPESVQVGFVCPLEFSV